MPRPPQIEMRTLALAHVAVFDAVNAVTRWAGIHTRTADEHGTALGRRVGELAVQRAMKKIE